GLSTAERQPPVYPAGGLSEPFAALVFMPCFKFSQGQGLDWCCLFCFLHPALCTVLLNFFLHHSLDLILLDFHTFVRSGRSCISPSDGRTIGRPSGSDFVIFTFLCPVTVEKR